MKKVSSGSLISYKLISVTGILLLFCLMDCQKRECPFSNASNSPEEIATRFLTALKDKDEDALWSLMVTEYEYKEILWPPYQAKSGSDSDQPWFINWMDAKKTIGRALFDCGGKELKLVRVYFNKGKDKSVGPFRIWRDCRIIVKDKNGEKQELDYINTVVEMQGCYKVVAYHS
jgi:hypothetical protein